MHARVTRVSTNTTDAGYAAYSEHGHHGITATLNGEKVTNAFTADEVEGFVEVHAKDANGKLMFSELGDAMTETKRGEVRIIIKGIQE